MPTPWPSSSRSLSSLVRMKNRNILSNLPDDASQGFKAADLHEFELLDRHMREVEFRFFGPAGMENYLKEP